MDVLWMFYGSFMDVLWMFYGCFGVLSHQIAKFLGRHMTPDPGAVPWSFRRRNGAASVR